MNETTSHHKLFTHPSKFSVCGLKYITQTLWMKFRISGCSAICKHKLPGTYQILFLCYRSVMANKKNTVQLYIYNTKQFKNQEKESHQ